MTDKARVIATYTAAADHFDALPFWHEYGQRTVDRLRLSSGARVLDLCCGTGASALPAARAVGPTGSVLGVDLTLSLVERARALAADARLSQARFIVGDVETLACPPGSFDAIVSVFGIFFLDDMAGVLRRAWSWLASGGQLAITVWGEVVLAPGEALFWEAVRHEDPSLEHISPADRLARPEALDALFFEAGLPPPAISTERWRMPLATPEAFWPVILGTSNRGVLDALSPEAQRRVRAFVEDELRRRCVSGLEMEGLVAVATRPGQPPRAISGSVTDPDITVARRPSLGSGGVLS
jgi:ubiquinone/menaquinone biosynthesis C-methylase UbiE